MKGVIYWFFPPKSRDRIISYCRYLEQKGKIKQAYNILFEIFCEEKFDKNLALCNNLGYYAILLFKKTKDPTYLTWAERAFVCATAFSASNAQLLYNKLEFSFLLQQPNYVTAAECLDVILPQNRQNFEFNVLGAETYIALKRYDEALECLQVIERSAEKDFWDEIDLYYSLAFVCKELGKVLRALDYIKKLEKLIYECPRGFILSNIGPKFHALYQEICSLAKADTVRNKPAHGEEFKPED